MMWLPDGTMDRLCRVADVPDLSGTRYDLIQKLGRGGMASVYLARDRVLGREVALKLMNDAAPDPDAAWRTAQEARIIAGLEHPGIVPIHDMGVLPDGRTFYAMKRVQGTGLDAFASAGRDVATLLGIFQKVCEAVAFAHARGVLHRDLKPQNVMVGSFGEVLVMDWGIAKLLKHPPVQPTSDGQQTPSLERVSGATEHGAVMGTPGYMAPEQARGSSAAVDERADVYALGGILEFMLARASPAAGQQDRSEAQRGAFPRSVRRELRAICLKSRASDPNDRYATVEELAADIANFVAGRRVRAYREGILGPIRRAAWNYRTPIVLVAAYLLMRILLLAWART
jgi:serine/threonine protein kinase